MGSLDTSGAEASADAPGHGFVFPRIPVRCQVWVGTSVAAAVVLPFLLQALPHHLATGVEVRTGLVLVVLSVLNVEIGRLLEGGVSSSQRPHKALSAWAFASALLLPTWWLLPVVAITYAHAWWRGLRVQVWKWVGSAAYIVLAGLAAAATARAVLAGEPNLMAGNGLQGLLAVLVALAAFLTAETVMFHGSAYLNSAADETWLRQTLRSPSFYLTEAAVLLVGGLSAAIWTGGPWFLLLLVPVYALTQRAALHEPLRERADHDDKTGLLRFESWRGLAVAGAERCRRKHLPFTVLFADLDHFKSFNDAWGHLAGDDALVAVARTIRAELHEGALVGRFGGEEYCAFLPGVGRADAARIAERLRAAVAALAVAGHHVTISIGGASVEPGDEGSEFIVTLTAADRALFEAKARGRNMVRISD